MQTPRGSDPIPRAELDLRAEAYKHDSVRHSSLCKDPPDPRIWCNSCPRMPDVTLIDLRLGRKTMDLRFWRDGEETKFEVLRRDASSVVLRPIADGLCLKTLSLPQV